MAESILSPSVSNGVQLARRYVGWRPIETAPKSGMAILGFMWIGDSRVTRVLHWDEEDAQWHSQGQQYHPTHWMPLPEPPR
jgi:hypothetical protein